MVFLNKNLISRKMMSRLFWAGFIVVFVCLFYIQPASALSDWTTGKFGKAYNFYGVAYTNIGDTGGSVKTVSFWIRVVSASGKVAELNSSAYISVSGGTVSTTGFDTPTIYVDGVAASAISDSLWHLVVVTTNTAISASAMKFGSIDANSLIGEMDDFKIYNRVLSTREIAEQYRQKSPSIAQGGTVTGNFYIVGSSNQLGIGTITPKNVLDVEGGAVIGSSYSGSYLASTNGLLVEGKTGIGTAGPDRMLDILDATGPQMRLTYTDGSVYTDFQTTSSGYLSISPSGGNVGIGTTTPNWPLSVLSTSTAQIAAVYDGSNYTTFQTNSSGDLTIAPSGGDLTISGNLTVTGKTTHSGGVDPLYVLYDRQTREQIIERVGFEVPLEKQTGATLFFNTETGKLETYLASENKFFELQMEEIGLEGLSLREDGSIISTATESNEAAFALDGATASQGGFFSGLISQARQALASLGLFIQDGIARAKEFIADKITVKTARIEKMEIVDQQTGEVWCTWLQNGEWQKVKADCDRVEFTDGRPAIVGEIVSGGAGGGGNGGGAPADVGVGSSNPNNEGGITPPLQPESETPEIPEIPILETASPSDNVVIPEEPAEIEPLETSSPGENEAIEM